MPDSRASSCLCDAAVRHAVTSTVAADLAGLMEQNLRGGRASFGEVMRAVRTKCGPSSQEICVTSGLSGRLAYIASKYMRLWFTRGPEASRLQSVISARCRRCPSMAMESDSGALKPHTTSTAWIWTCEYASCSNAIRCHPQAATEYHVVGTLARKNLRAD